MITHKQLKKFFFNQYNLYFYNKNIPLQQNKTSIAA